MALLPNNADYGSSSFFGNIILTRRILLA